MEIESKLQYPKYHTLKLAKLEYGVPHRKLLGDAATQPVVILSPIWLYEQKLSWFDDLITFRRYVTDCKSVD